MWIKKSEYDALKSIHCEKTEGLAKETIVANNDIRIKKAKLEATAIELDKLLNDARNLKNNIPQKYTTVKEPVRDALGNYDFGYYENITQIINNKYYQWFVYEFREKVISQVAHNMGVEKKFFLVNTEEIAGGIKVIDHLMQEMERVRLDHNTIIEADKNAGNRDNEI